MVGPEDGLDVRVLPAGALDHFGPETGQFVVNVIANKLLRDLPLVARQIRLVSNKNNWNLLVVVLPNLLDLVDAHFQDLKGVLIVEGVDDHERVAVRDREPSHGRKLHRAGGVEEVHLGWFAFAGGSHSGSHFGFAVGFRSCGARFAVGVVVVVVGR
ncbi:Hypothetical predicted protein [Olea europaea subsp. europaea]|uniref:Uncharacterized protein n=1 Tax=Olea europaea subsp. europaea TaxID=158383 RepID=A0A8S0RC79_OLEEU|nr:Hypothetical predicted protein [Olea europaea subsp. europaea]